MASGIRRLSAGLLSKVFCRDRLTAFQHLLWCSRKYDFSALCSAVRAYVDNVVSKLHNIGVMLDDNHRISPVNQGFKNTDDLFDICGVQPRCRLVLYIDIPLFLDVLCKLDSLPLATGKGRKGLPQGDIGQSNFHKRT